jgi:hypothetical protein
LLLKALGLVDQPILSNEAARLELIQPHSDPGICQRKARSPGLQVSDPTQEPYRRTKVRKRPDADEYGESSGSGIDV